MDAADPAATHTSSHSIGAYSKPAQGYISLVGSGEFGLMPPGNIDIQSGRVEFDDTDIEEAIKRAFTENRVYVRAVRVDLPATANPGPRPKAGIAEPTLELGKPTPFEK